MEKALVERLEAAVARLEAAAAAGPSGAPLSATPRDLEGVPAASDPAIVAYDEFVAQAFGRLNAAAEKIGGKVLEATKVLAEAFAVAKDLLVRAKQLQKPASMASAQDFFKPLNDACAKAAAMTEGRRPDYFNHMKSVADSLAALAWVAFLGKDMGMSFPTAHVEESPSRRRAAAMEEEKAAAYYEELNRKGEGARRFKQGLGFSSGEPQPAAFPSKPATSSSFLSGFVRAGAAPAQPPKSTRPPPPPEPAPLQRRRSRSPSPSRPRPRSRSRSPSRSRRRRSRSRSRSREPRRRSRSREREDRRASRYRSRSRSPSRRSGRHDEARRDRHGDRRRDDDRRQEGHGGRGGGKVDYSRMIQGYDKMTPAERVKAKMKLQLSETASKDSTLGTATVGWGRFEFNKDAPLDEDDNDVEGANDDASLVKHIGKSFRLSALESKNENTVRDAHDEAMFGVPMSSNLDTQASEDELKTNDYEGKKARDVDDRSGSSLISPEVLAMQKGSWRDRIQKLRQNSNT